MFYARDQHTNIQTHTDTNYAINSFWNEQR